MKMIVLNLKHIIWFALTIGSSVRYWGLGGYGNGSDYSIIGQNYNCRFAVPADASGEASISVSAPGNGYTMFIPRRFSGWVTGVTPVLGE